MTPEQVAEFEKRLLALEREVTTLRRALSSAVRCTCPVGFGSEPDSRCPRHGSR